jgi:hypothetical protein
LWEGFSLLILAAISQCALLFPESLPLAGDRVSVIRTPIRDATVIHSLLREERDTPANTQKVVHTLFSIVRMIVSRLLMPRMIMVMGSVLAAVIVAVAICCPRMAVGMVVLMRVFVSMGMFVGMAVAFVAMLVGMLVLVLVFVGMLMFVFMVAFHGYPPCFLGCHEQSATGIRNTF